MSRVNGSGRPVGPNTDDEKKRPQKRETKKAREFDSSEENQSTESLEECGKSRAAMKSKQPPKEKQVHVAPHSTSHKNEESTAPAIRPSSKREAFQRKAKRETEIGAQGRHRRRESDFQGNYPGLKSLQKAQRQKDLESRPASLDPLKLVEQAKAAGGHLNVQVKDKKDVDVLVKVLNANPSIRSLKLNCDLGGKSGRVGDLERDDVYSAVVFHGENIDGPALPDSDSLAGILDACKHVQALDLKGCRPTEKAWHTLASYLNRTSKLQRLEIGKGDLISSAASKGIASAISSGNSSIRELVIEDMPMGYVSFQSFMTAMKKHGKFSRIKLQNVSHPMGIGNFCDLQSIFALCISNPELKELSMAGTRREDSLVANDDAYDAYFSVHRNSAEGREFKKHANLHVLDLSHCGLKQSEMGDLAAACDGHASLLDIRIEGNRIVDSDLAKINATQTRNRERLQAQATKAFDLLATHAAGKVDDWPRELSEVLTQNTPPEILPDIAAVIDTPHPEKASGTSDSKMLPKKQ